MQTNTAIPDTNTIRSPKIAADGAPIAATEIEHEHKSDGVGVGGAWRGATTQPTV